MARRRKNSQKKFSIGMQRKLTRAFALILLSLVLLLLRIAVINTTRGNRYAKQVLSQQSYDSRSIPARRGEIQDRNGIILAKSDRYYRMILDCYEVNQNKDFLEPTVTALSTLYGIPTTKLKDLITSEKTRNSRYQILIRQMTKEDKQAFEDYKAGTYKGMSRDVGKSQSAAEAESERSATVSAAPVIEMSEKERALIRGIWFEEIYVRSYPYKTLASNVIGFSNAQDIGMTGIENYYNDTLTGTDGREFGYLNDNSEFERTTIEPAHGKTLRLTLDMNVQEIVQKHIDEFDQTYGDQSHHGKGAQNVGVLVMDPTDCSVLAMASNHAYDLTDPFDLSEIIETETEEDGSKVEVSIDDETRSKYLHDKWYNFCVSESYEPGSVFKPITVSSALEEAAVHDGDHYYCGGNLFITDTTINCDNVYGHGDETLEYAIVNSCNVALMQIGMKLGITRFIEYQKMFNYGTRTGIDLPDESAGVIYNRDTMHEVELATCTFGQGFTCTMVQEASAFCTVVNGGYYYQPHVVKQILNSDGTVATDVEPLVLREPISTSVSRMVRGYLETAVQKGTGRKSQVPGYRTGGKTGTAEKINLSTGTRAKGKYLVSFIGAAPIDEPKVVMYCVVDEPNVAEQADSSYAQYLFRDIAMEIFPYLGIYPTSEVSDELLESMGLTRAQLNGSNVKSPTFQAFDSYGNLYNDASVTAKGQVVDSNGNILAGCSVDLSSAIVTDGYGNQIPVDLSAIISAIAAESSDQVAENPDIATPPLGDPDGDSNATTWGGATVDEEKEEEE